MRPGLAPKGSNRSRGTKLTVTQRNSLGQRSEWSQPANLEFRLSVTTHESRWSQTVGNTTR